MFFKIRQLFFLVVAVFVLSSCSEYQKVLKNEDVKAKYDMAEKYYEEGDYKRANRLFEQIAPKYVGKPQGERVMFFLANTFLKVWNNRTSSLLDAKRLRTQSLHRTFTRIKLHRSSPYLSRCNAWEERSSNIFATKEKCFIEKNKLQTNRTQQKRISSPTKKKRLR